MFRQCPRILVIAGSDSGGGAGVQADVKTVTMLGGHAMTAITALTAQNTLGVRRVEVVPVDMVMAQVAACVEDIGVDAVKIGMLGSADIAHAVADWLDTVAVPVVFDPVMVATSGDVLADADTIAAFERLIRVAAVVTPNTAELSALAGLAITDEVMQGHAAAAVLERTGGRALLAKGGHLVVQGDTWLGTEAGNRRLHDNATQVYDSLYQAQPNDDGVITWNAPRLDTRHTHGTGCTLASAIATGLGGGMTLPDAIGRGIRFVRAAMLAAPGFGAGHGPMGHTLGTVPFDVLTRGAAADA